MPIIRINIFNENKNKIFSNIILYSFLSILHFLYYIFYLLAPINYNKFFYLSPFIGNNL